MGGVMMTQWNSYNTSTHTDEAFCKWLNRIDAMIGHDRRGKISLAKWNHLFQFGYSGFDAVQACFTPDELMD
jgi:hypothetical protein